MTRVGGRRSSGFSLSDVPPCQLLCVIVIVLFLIFFSWYMTYESTMEDTVDQLKMIGMITPLLLLLLVRWLSAGRPPVVALPSSDPDSFHRAGSSPWGVAILLIILLMMISYQSSFHEQWFPLFRRD